MAYSYYNTNPYYPQPNFYPNNNATPDMLNQFKSYQQPIQQVPQMQQPTQTQMSSNMTDDRVWVQGEVGAKAFFVANGNAVTLWDSESPKIYRKSVDINGIPSMETLTYNNLNENAPKTPTEHVCQCGSKFTPKEDFNALQSRFEGLSAKFEELEEKIQTLTTKPTPKTTKNTKGDAE